MNRVNSETGCYYYDSAVTAEVVRAKTAEKNLSVLIDEERRRAREAENSLADAVEAESRRAEEKEAEIEGKFESFISEASGTLDGIKQIEANLVHRSGDETISDIKTFSSSPRVPTPGSSSKDTTVANTAFVHSLLNTKTTCYITSYSGVGSRNGYLKFNTGLIIQWFKGVQGVNTIPVPMASGDYTVVVTPYGGNDGFEGHPNGPNSASTQVYLSIDGDINDFAVIIIGKYKQ